MLLILSVIMNKENMSKRSRRLLLIIAVAALVGLADTIYLTISHFQGSEVVCSIIDGCNVVLSSSWATILGLPTALIGGFYYLAILTLLLVFYYRRNQMALLGVLALTTVGFFLSLGFLYLQLFVIEAICQYCLLSIVATTTMWVAALGQVYGRDVNRL